MTVHTGRAVVLARDDVDTDQITPAQFCKRLTKHGYEDALFAGWRGQPGFPLDQPHLRDASVLVAGNNFGTGSSREHAVWALRDWGFVAVIAISFGDIFRRNALKNGLLAISLPEADVAALSKAAETDPDLPVTVDLEECEVRAGELRRRFDVDSHARYLLLNGLDDIALTEQQDEDISRYERGRKPWLPSLRPGCLSGRGAS
ncbi:3-isopropylmalate dehydratase small subunit [Saccharothrix coeruleofusca]|uniref:3-isopropylmalate dehydratase small subunit n=1 Tax=Saccharothrix coeruleofusca TaxID=33919 RepID=UPI001AE88B98|nr:3-isopropylmalate dehydratase small subunit [Saccharothrix coeruleofusca]MBP2336014.1 3-isopropylmalate/(R)-2-methylmalate dehydratase small subunit [Saccharothrix coeruleofusca]